MNEFYIAYKIALDSNFARESDFARQGKIDGESDFTREGKFTTDIDFARHGKDASLIENT